MLFLFVCFGGVLILCLFLCVCVCVCVDFFLGRRGEVGWGERREPGGLLFYNFLLAIVC